MARDPKPRVGTPVSVKGRRVEFSYWPMYRTSRRYGLHSHVYATNPWALIESSVRDSCPPSSRAEALGSLEQARYFFRGSLSSQEWAAKPLPLYYSFMNLAKVFGLVRAIRVTFDKAQHGLTEQLGAGGKELDDAYLEAYPSPGARGPNVFADFLAVCGTTLAAKTTYKLPALLPQIIAGHRFWCNAANQQERFVAVESIPLLHDDDAKQIWAELRLYQDDLSRIEKSRKDFVRDCRLTGDVRGVEGTTEPGTDRPIIKLEQKVPLGYTSITADKIPEVVAALRPFIWSTATSVHPFRKYYLYTSPSSEHASVLPQLASIFAIAYYLGSITRYRPQHFNRIIGGKFGHFIQEFLSSQPSQFLYLLASDIAKRDVTRAPLV